jgi:hypothetical protein
MISFQSLKLCFYEYIQFFSVVNNNTSIQIKITEISVKFECYSTLDSQILSLDFKYVLQQIFKPKFLLLVRN